MLSLAALEPPPDLDAITTTPHLHGDRTTFVFRGNADRVGIRHFMARFPRFPVFDRIDRDLHVLTVELPLGARVEYLLEVTERAAERTVLDPLNPRTATNPFGRNSVAFGPGYAEPWWIRPWSGPKGVLRRGHVESGAFGERRSLQWYHPPALRGRLPLVVVHDGRDFVEHAALVTVLDNLIGASVIPPVVAAIIDPDERLIEYGADDRQAAFIREVVDLAVRRHRVDPDPDAHVYLGASFGGVAALHAAWTNGPVGGVVTLSGSFVTALGGPNRRGRVFVPVIDFVRRFTWAPGRPAQRIYQACGSFEGLGPDNEAFAGVLRRTGADLVTEQHPDGHHWHNWRDRLGAALAHVVPGGDPTRLGSVAW